MQYHVILTNGRSGSNYLRNLLNQHPQIVNYGEVLGDWTIPYKLHQKINLGGNSNESYLDYLYHSKTFFYFAQLYSAFSKIKKQEKINFKIFNQVKTLGFKDFSIYFFSRNLENYLKEREDILIINLFRQNSLKRLVSLIAMEASGVVALNSKEQVKSGKIYVPLDDLLEKLDIFEKEKQDQFTLIEGIEPTRILNIAYEDYFSSSQSQLNYNQKILGFLNVSEMELESKLTRILPDNLADKIDNYQEVFKLLTGTKYQCYLSS